MDVKYRPGAAQIDSTCPGGVGHLGTNYTIVGDRSNYTGFVWVRPSDDLYVVTCNPNCSSVAGYRATNDPSSILTIESVGNIDAGTWNIRNADETGAVGVCKLTVAQTPECTVSGDRDTDALDLDTALLLTVNVTDYYCSELTGLSLITGAVLETLKVNHNVSGVTSDVINKTVSINLSSLGDVRVRFTCDDTSYNLSCRGVQRLLKSPPQCNISSDSDTNALDLGTNLNLTLELRGYYCSQQAGFDLTTGSVTDVLLQNQTTNNITDTVQHHSFNVTSDRFGDVSVTFRCDNSNRTLSCGGVSKLTETPSPSEGSTTPKSTTSTTESSPTDLTLGLAIGLPVFVCVVALIVFTCICKRERLKQIGKYIVSGSRRTNTKLNIPSQGISISNLQL